MGPDRLRALETGRDAPTAWEAEALARICRVDAGTLALTPIHVAPDDVVMTLASVDEFEEMGAPGLDVGDARRANVA